jgi:hypothetical protein
LRTEQDCLGGQRSECGLSGTHGSGVEGVGKGRVAGCGAAAGVDGIGEWKGCAAAVGCDEAQACGQTSGMRGE